MQGFQTDISGQGDWATLLRNYRHGPKSVYGPELVGRLDAYISAVAQGLDAVPPAIDATDIYQQLVQEVLIAAERLQMPSRPQWIPRQLILRATRQVARWLAREKARKPLALTETVAAETRAAIGLTFPLAAGIGISEEDLTLLHRFYVLGESGKDLAAELDVSVPTLWRRVSRAADRCRDSVQSRTPEDNKGRQGTQKGRLVVSSFDHEDGQLRKDGSSGRISWTAQVTWRARGGSDDGR